jgi:serine/threonine protein kinase
MNINTPSLLPVGTILHGTYSIESYLSSGGFGNTYVVTNVQFGETRAIKEFYLKGICQREGDSTTVSVSNSENTISFNQQCEKFKKEARRLRGLDNPHIVKVYDLFEENGTAYYVMDYVDGENLSTRLARTNTPLAEKTVLNYLNQILDGLHAIHNSGMLHLDIKPANIMVDKNDVVKLIDFGASKQQTSTDGVTTTTGVYYTNGYAPIEQIAQSYDKFGPWTDFYALGATLYKLLTNQNPPSLSDIREDSNDDKHTALAMPQVSKKTKQLVVWMMDDNRLVRPQSVKDIRVFLSSEANVSVDNKPANKKAKRNIAKVVRTVCLSLFATVTVLSLSYYGYSKFRQRMLINQLVDNMVEVKGGTLNGISFNTFYIGKFEVTNEEFHAVMDDRGVDYFIRAQMGLRLETWASIKESTKENCKLHHPMIIGRKNVTEFIKQLNKKTGRNFRLPTDREWEIAAKGGINSQGNRYAGSDDINRIAWCDDGVSLSHTREVGKKYPNELGLYDMTGNVDELCDNVVGDAATDRWSVRGGCARDLPADCLISKRKPLGSDCLVGFRLVLDEK